MLTISHIRAALAVVPILAFSLSAPAQGIPVVEPPFDWQRFVLQGQCSMLMLQHGQADLPLTACVLDLQGRVNGGETSPQALPSVVIKDTRSFDTRTDGTRAAMSGELLVRSGETCAIDRYPTAVLEQPAEFFACSPDGTPLSSVH